MFKDSVVLITGGTGSFGKAFTRRLLMNHNPRKVIIFSRDEFKQHEMAKEFPLEQFPNIRFFLGDIRDKDRLHRAFHGVDYIVHAAALKQVPTAEYNPIEAVKTNIMGTVNIIDAAIDQGVKKVMALSTDKAVCPVNLYGATKLCSDKLIVAGNAYSTLTRFSVVRYGNVMGSRGSVIPLFRQCRESGVIPVTDPRMTRFWITLEQAVDRVLDAFGFIRGGEIVVPKLPSMNIMDLAQAVAPGCKVNVIGIRPGEKLHELLSIRDEARNTWEFDDHYVIGTPFSHWLQDEDVLNGKPVPEDFEYSSETNPWKLKAEELRQALGDA